MPSESYTPTVYLAGPVQHMDDGGHGWRDDVEWSYDEQIDFLNPLDKYDTPATEVVWLGPGEDESDYPDAEEVCTPQDIIDADKEMIDESDVVFIGLRESVPMYGTPREHEYALQTDTPVVVWYDEGMDLSPWTIEGTAFLSTSLKDCMEYIFVQNTKEAIEADITNVIKEHI